MRYFPPTLALLVALGGLAAWQMPTSAEAPRKVDLTSQSKVWFEGDSTLHPYQVTVKQWESNLAVGPRQGDSARLSDIAFVIPVRGMKSKEKALDDNMYKALNADRHATIRFRAPQGTLKYKSSGAVSVEADGRLTVNGTERPITIKAEGRLVGAQLQLKGSHALKMSDYGVQAPVLFGGMIKTSDQVVVHYDLTGKITN